MAPVISFVAWSNTGKTTYLEKLIPELKKAGIRIAVIKHDAHNFQLDTEGKDSWRFMNAGAESVAVASDTQFALLETHGRELDEIIPYFSDADIILTEGYKYSRYPKVAIFRAASGKPLAIPPEECAAIVSDTPIDAPCPVFPLEDPKPMARYLLDWLKNERRG